MTKRNQQDALYRMPQTKVSKFTFDEKVAAVFPDMIRRSVPGYEDIITLIGLVAEHYAKPQSHLYDLGCSLGAATLSMASRVDLDGSDCRIIAVDNSEAMIQKCHDSLNKHVDMNLIDLICSDIQNIEISNASVAVLNFTLQFIEREQREGLLKHIYNGLNPGGVLVLSEKIKVSDNEVDSTLVDLHHSFKRANGYSDMEVSQKRDALENVLLPESLETHLKRLNDVGFQQAHVWYQCFNFISILAWK